MKKLVLMFLSLILVFVLASCGDCPFTDENGDGICDECGEGEPKKPDYSNGIDLPEVEF